MADEKELHEEEEYQFSDLEGGGEPFVTEKRVERIRTTRTVGTNVFIAIAVIVGVLIAYKLFEYFYAPRPRVVPPPPPPVVEQPLQRPVETVPPSVTSSLTQLQQQVTDQDTALKTMQSQVTALQTSLSDLTTTIAALNSKIDALQKELAEKPKPVIVEKPVKVVRPRRVTYRPIAPPPVYFIKALIPGRAWLIDENGATLTVRRGNFLPGYGRITRVSTQEGVVNTSSGRIIRYGPDDI